jgi:hypothetical protein
MTKNGRKYCFNFLVNGQKIGFMVKSSNVFFGHFVKYINEKSLYYHFIQFKHIQNEPKNIPIASLAIKYAMTIDQIYYIRKEQKNNSKTS